MSKRQVFRYTIPVDDQRREVVMTRNLTRVGIDPAPAEKPGIVYLHMRTADSCWSLPVTLDDLREIHEVTGRVLPAWQGVKDVSAVVSALMTTRQGRPVNARNNTHQEQS